MSVLSTLKKYAEQFSSAFEKVFWQQVKAFVALLTSIEQAAISAENPAVQQVINEITTALNAPDLKQLQTTLEAKYKEVQQQVNGIAETFANIVQNPDQYVVAFYDLGLLRDCARQGVLNANTVATMTDFLNSSGISGPLTTVANTLLGASKDSSGNMSMSIQFSGTASAIIGVDAGAEIAHGTHKGNQDACLLGFASISVGASIGADVMIGAGASKSAPHDLAGQSFEFAISISIAEAGAGINFSLELSDDFKNPNITGFSVFWAGGAEGSVAFGVQYAVRLLELKSDGLHLPEELGADTNFTPTNGALYQAKGEDEIYQVENGARRWIPDPYTLQQMEQMGQASPPVTALKASKIHGIPKDLAYPSRMQNTLLVGSGAVFYLMQNGQKCAFPNQAALQAWGFKPLDAKFCLDGDLNAIPNGPPLSSQPPA